MKRSSSHNVPLSQEAGYSGGPHTSGYSSRPDIITDYPERLPLTRYSSDYLYGYQYHDPIPEQEQVSFQKNITDDYSYGYGDHYRSSGNVNLSYDNIPSPQTSYSGHFKGYLHEVPYIEKDLTPDDENANTYAVVELISVVAENIVSHPFIILRRQCQIHNNPRKLHTLPTSLAPVVFHLWKRQGIASFWKGFSSVCLIRGITTGVEIGISTLTQWPKDLSNCASFVAFWRHIALKCLSIAIITPFYAASLVETVESNNFKFEKPGALEVIRGGFVRLGTWGLANKNKMLPIYAIVIPTVTYGIAKYFFNISVKGVISKILKFRQKELHTKESIVEIESESSFSAMMITEIVFFPLETIMHRLFLQGTRTIIDDLYNGYAVLPILTTYEGFFDCYRTTVIQEGFQGLYKGFGALILQFAALKLVRYLIFRPPVFSSISWLQKVKQQQNGGV